MLSYRCGNKIKFFYAETNGLVIHSYLYILMALIRCILKHQSNTPVKPCESLTGLKLNASLT